MNIFGKVEVILNENIVIISSSEFLSPDEIVNVFSSIDSPKLKEMGYEDPLLYPKGELRILCQQANKMYLAESFRGIEKKTRTVVTPSPFARSLSSFWSQLQPETKEITMEVPGKRSAELNKEQSLNVPISNVVSVGDLIGRL